MSKEVLIFLHMDDKDPGYIAVHLQKNNIPYRVVRGYTCSGIQQGSTAQEVGGHN